MQRLQRDLCLVINSSPFDPKYRLELCKKSSSFLSRIATARFDLSR